MREDAAATHHTAIVPALPTRVAPLVRRRDDTDTDLSSVVAKLNKAFDAAAPAAAAPTPPPPPRPASPFPTVPGFVLEKVLGCGGMGTVYLARQESLDRPVALKIMSRKWADEPLFLARFTREAFAAAQLSHPNIVQIYDIGESDGCRYFSMEYVAGKTLADLTVAAGKLDPETAVGYILQAARGLKHAHDRGMIHRDIKPDNLLVTPQGLVKVADLGLVKTPDLPAAADRPAGGRARHALAPGMTGARIALGTPAYMSPEQCRDAAGVDHRADIYSLGCTLYALVTGKQPFDGTTAVELMTKQAYQPLVPPEEIAARVPKELSAVIQTMMAKLPGDRFQTMGEVVRTLEEWLGVPSAGTFAPREDQIAELEAVVRRYHFAPPAVLRDKCVTAVVSGCVLAAIVLTGVGKLAWAFGLAGMMLQAALFHFLLTGLARKSYLFDRVRQFVHGMTAGDWLVAAAGLATFGVFLWASQLFWVWVGFGLIGAGVAVWRRVGLDRAVEADRRAALVALSRLVKRLRAAGRDEAAVRLFVAKYAGRRWEEVFEAAFGFEAKLAARQQLLRGGYAGERETFAAWREPVIALIDAVEKARRADRERRVLAAAEFARLTADGMSRRAARALATKSADSLLARAAVVRTAEARGGPPASGVISNVRAMLADSPAAPADDDLLGFLAGLWVGPPVAALVGVLLVAACTAWAWQNGVFHTAAELTSRPLVVPGVPAEWLAWCDTANVGWGGVLLLASLFFRGHRMAVLVVVGAAVAVLGHKAGVRTVEPIRDFHVSLMVGTVLALVGYRCGRR